MWTPKFVLLLQIDLRDLTIVNYCRLNSSTILYDHKLFMSIGKFRNIPANEMSIVYNRYRVQETLEYHFMLSTCCMNNSIQYSYVLLVNY